MTKITINGIEYSVDLSNATLSGFSGNLPGFNDVNGLPKINVDALVNGVSQNIDVTFAGHHIFSQNISARADVTALFQAVNFDPNSFAHNGVALPNFAPGSTASAEMLAISAQFGASHTGGHRDFSARVDGVVRELAEARTDLAMRVDSGLASQADLDAFDANAKKTVFGVAAGVQAELHTPLNNSTIHKNDPNFNGTPAFENLSDQIDTETGGFVEGSEFGNRDIVQAAGRAAGDQAVFDTTQHAWSDDLDLKSPSNNNIGTDIDLVAGNDLAGRYADMEALAADLNARSNSLIESVKKVGLSNALEVGLTVNLLSKIVVDLASELNISNSQAADLLGLNSQELAEAFAKEIILDAAVSAALGPFALLRKVYQIYEALDSGKGIAELIVAAYPDNDVAKAIAVVLETIDNAISRENLESLLPEYDDAGLVTIGGIVVSDHTHITELLDAVSRGEIAAENVYETLDGKLIVLEDSIPAGQFVDLTGDVTFEDLALIFARGYGDAVLSTGVDDLGRDQSITVNDVVLNAGRIFEDRELVEAIVNRELPVNPASGGSYFGHLTPEEVGKVYQASEAAHNAAAFDINGVETGQIDLPADRAQQILDMFSSNPELLSDARVVEVLYSNFGTQQATEIYVNAQSQFNGGITAGVGYDFRFDRPLATLPEGAVIAGGIDELGNVFVIENTAELRAAVEAAARYGYSEDQVVQGQINGQEDVNGPETGQIDLPPATGGGDTSSGASGSGGGSSSGGSGHNGITLADLVPSDESVVHVIRDGNGNTIGFITETQTGETIQRLYSRGENGELLETKTITTDYATITQTSEVTRDPETGEIVKREEEVVHIDYNTQGQRTGEAIGGALTPFLTRAIIGEDGSVLEQIAVDTVLGTVLENVGESIGGLIDLAGGRINDLVFNSEGIEKIIGDSFVDFGGELLNNGANNAFSVVNQLILGEIFEAVELDGVEGVLFEAVSTLGINTLTNTVGNILFSKVDAVNINVGVDFKSITTNLETGAILSAGEITGNIASFLFTIAAKEYLPQAETLEGQIAGAVASAIFGTLAGGALAGPVGVIAALVVGQIFDGLFADDPHAWTYVSYHEETGRFEIDRTDVEDGGDLPLSIAMAEIYVDTMNQFADAIGGNSNNLSSAGNWILGASEGALWNAGESGSVFQTFNEAYANAVLRDLVDLDPVDGYATTARAIQNSGLPSAEELASLQYSQQNTSYIPAEAYSNSTVVALQRQIDSLRNGGGGNNGSCNLNPETHPEGCGGGDPRSPDLDAIRSLESQVHNILQSYRVYVDRSNFTGNSELLNQVSTNIQIAEDYSSYLENREVINLLIRNNPNSALAAGWISTLAIAAELGLSDSYDLVGDSVDNVFYTADGDDAVNGAAGDDFIKTYGGDDELVGGSGDDILIGGLGSDVLYGNSGADTFEFSGLDSTVDSFDIIKDFNPAEDKINLYGMIDSADEVIIEEFDGNTVLTIAGNEDFYLLVEGVGHNIGADQIVFQRIIEGTNDAENLTGEGGPDVINGRGGDDTVSGGAGDDELIGGGGDDIIIGGTGDDKLYGGGENDTLIGGRGSDELFGHSGSDTFEFADGDTTTEAFDTIKDFNPAEDKIDLYGLVGSLDEVLIEEVDGNTVLTIAGNEDFYLLVEGVGHNIGADQIVFQRTIEGTAAADNLRGGAGEDTILGFDGDDILNGGEGKDRIFGGNGNDTLSAGANGQGGFQYLYGQSGNDTYRISKQDGQNFIGSSVAETAASGTADRVVFSDLNLSDMAIDYYDYGDVSPHGNSLRLIWDDGTHSGELRVGQEGQYIETFEFADGAMVSQIAINPNGGISLFGDSEGNYITGTNGRDWIYGGDGDDGLAAGLNTEGGFQYLYGQSGNDTYRISKQDGQNFIGSSVAETAVSGTADRVVFSDLNLSDITIGYHDYGDASPHGNSLRLIWDDGTHSGELRIGQEGQYIEEFQFADGTTLSAIEGDWLARLNPDLYSDVYANKLTGTSGDDIINGTDRRDYIYAGDGDDVLTTGANNDFGYQHLYGQGGNDTYLISSEDGDIFLSGILEGANQGTADRVVFEDLTLSDLTIDFYDYGSDHAEGNAINFNWDDGTHSGELRIGQEGQYIETFEFADGTTLSGIEHNSSGIGYLHLTGTDGNDVINGTAARETIYGGAGDDDISAGRNTEGGWQYVYGQEGDDTYRVSKEDSRVFITTGGEDAATGAADRVVFTDLNLSDISVSYHDYAGTGSAAQGNALRLQWNDGTNFGELRIGQEGQYIETFEFADGTTLSSIAFNPVGAGYIDLRGTDSDDTINGTNDQDRLYGGAGDDVLSAGLNIEGGWQYLYGQTGNDTYLIGSEDGDVFISGSSEGASHGQSDRVVFEDLALSDLMIDFYDYGSDHVEGNAINFNWENETGSGFLRIGQEGQYIETFEFADGTTLSGIEHNSSGIGYLHLTGTDGNDVINGTAARETIYGGAGDDDISAGLNTEGGWQYVYGQEGDDTYRISKQDSRVFITSDGEGAGTGAADRVVFTDLNLSDITVDYFDYTGTGSAAQGNALRLQWNDGTNFGELRIAQEGQYIETFEFADGTTGTSIEVDEQGNVILLNATSPAGAETVDTDSTVETLEAFLPLETGGYLASDPIEALLLEEPSGYLAGGETASTIDLVDQGGYLSDDVSVETLELTDAGGYLAGNAAPVQTLDLIDQGGFIAGGSSTGTLELVDQGGYVASDDLIDMVELAELGGYAASEDTIETINLDEAGGYLPVHIDDTESGYLI